MLACTTSPHPNDKNIRGRVRVSNGSDLQIQRPEAERRRSRRRDQIVDQADVAIDPRFFSESALT